MMRESLALSLCKQTHFSLSVRRDLLGLTYHHQARGMRSPIESAFSSTREQKLLQQDNSKPKTQQDFKMGKGCRMLKPILQNVHPLLQLPKKVTLSCHVYLLKHKTFKLISVFYSEK